VHGGRYCLGGANAQVEFIKFGLRGRQISGRSKRRCVL